MEWIRYIIKIVYFLFLNIIGRKLDWDLPDVSKINPDRFNNVKEKMIYTLWMKENKNDPTKAVVECLSHITSHKGNFFLLKNKTNQGIDTDPIDISYLYALSILMKEVRIKYGENDIVEDLYGQFVDILNVNNGVYKGYNDNCIIDLKSTPEGIVIYANLLNAVGLEWSKSERDELLRKNRLFLKLSRISL